MGPTHWGLTRGWIEFQKRPHLGRRFIRIASLRRTVAAPNASNRVNADQKALNLGSGYRGISIAPQVNLERGKNMPGEMTIATASDRRRAAKNCARRAIVRWRICAHRVREGREKTLFPHLPGKPLISRKSRTISSESRLFNGLRDI